MVVGNHLDRGYQRVRVELSTLLVCDFDRMWSLIQGHDSSGLFRLFFRLFFWVFNSSMVHRIERFDQ